MSSTKPVTADIARSFSNILRLEGERDYTNAVVQGGLDRFIERNSVKLSALLTDHILAQDLLKVEYALMKPDERREWVLTWLNAMREDTVESNSTSSDISRKIAHPNVPTDAGTHTIKNPPFQVGSGKNAKVRSSINLDSPVDYLPYVGKRLTIKLNRLGVNNVSDILFLFPRRHSDFSHITTVSKLVPGNEQTVVVTVWEAKSERRGRSKRRDTEVVLGDATGNVKAVWFGQPHIARSLPTNSRVVISGKVGIYKGTPVFESPEYEVIDNHETGGVHTGRLIPVYPLTEGLSPRTLRRIVWTALDLCLDQVHELLPSTLIKETGLMPLANAILQAHYPDDLQVKEMARRRLAFDEFFLIQLAVLKQRNNNRQSANGISLGSQPEPLNRFLKDLPFELTKAQNKVLQEILADIATGTPPMSRLLQGEVGSGKTVVALGALLTAATNGYQSAIMAPTEILAEQHFLTLSKLLQGMSQWIEKGSLLSAYVDPHPNPIQIGLLTGSMSPRAKEKMRSRLATGSLDIVIGTQALVQESVKIPNLSLAVVDEQHRFGVLQRASLRDRGDGITPHVLVMSATPIPRTLALTIFGDLDISTIDELPPGRQEITTRWVPPNKRDKAYLFMQNQVNNGRQTFVICPLIEESDSLQAKAATEEYHRLSDSVFPDLRLGLLHGKMPTSEKDQVMNKFRSHELDILVSTPVVEVGIDVPNATVMLVETADRFGLSQLHQFRGRVGRGEYKSYCFLLAEDPSEVAQERLLAMEHIHNGFKLAEMDLSLRGPGEYFGTKQSGFPGLKMARLSDSDLLTMARQQAASLLVKDPQMAHKDHALLARAVNRVSKNVSDEVS